jgi:hypothetical protein
MQLTINLEGTPATSTIDVLEALQSLMRTPDVKVRCQDTSYDGPAGERVHCRTFIVLVPEVPPFTAASIRDRLGVLAEVYGQDCVAYKMRDYGCTVADLAGPRADKWLPFNNEFFVEY